MSREETLEFVDNENLAILVVTAGRTGGMGPNGTAALGADVQFGRTPAISAPAEAFLHLRGASLWYCHDVLVLIGSGE